MTLLLPILRETLEKARRSARLVRRVRTVTRDGVAFQQAYWVLPHQAKLEDMPQGAQLDLFDRAPDVPEEHPLSRVDLRTYLAGIQEEKVDKFTRESRALAARIADHMAQFPDRSTWSNSFADLPPDHALNVSDEAKALWGMSIQTMLPGGVREIKNMVRFFRAVASGELGLSVNIEDYTTKTRRARARWESLPRDDQARLHLRVYIDREDLVGTTDYDQKEYLFWVDQDMREFHPQWNWRVTAKSARDKARRIIDGIEGEVYGLKRREYILKPKEPPRKTLPEVDVSDPVKAVKELVSHGIKNYQDAIAVGEIIYNATVSEENRATFQTLKKRLEEMDELFRSYKTIQGARENLIVWMLENDRKIATTTDENYKRQLQERRNTDYERLADYEIKLKVKGKALDEKQKEIAEIRARLDGVKTSGEAILDFLSRVRPMGPEAGALSGAHYTHNQARDSVFKALSVFPRDWIGYMQTKKLSFHESKDGRCTGLSVYAQWGPGQKGHAKHTQAHEIGHVAESYKSLNEMSRQFVFSLADEKNGGRVKTKARAMRGWQKGLESEHLPDSYCGVLYEHGDTEIVSMAAGDLYEDYSNRLYKGKQYWSFVLGLWAGV